MTFRSPAIFTEIDPVKYEDQINTNFEKINESFIAIDNCLQVLNSQATTSYANLNFVDKLLLPAGPVGHDSFELDFQEDTDGVWTVQLNRSTPDGVQQAVIALLLHEFQSNTRPIINITEKVPAGDGPHRMILGLNSDGAPAMRALVFANEEPFSTDTQDSDFLDLVLYDFLYERNTDGAFIHTVNRVSQPIISNTAFQRRENTVETLNLTWQGLLPLADNDYEPFFLIPYDCEVIEASAILALGPQPGETIEVVLVRFGFTGSTINDRAEVVLRHSFKWGDDTDAFPAVSPRDYAVGRVKSHRRMHR